MRTETEIANLKGELDRLVGFIWDHGTPKQTEDSKMSFASDTVDVLSWVTGVIESESFLSTDYLGLDHLRKIARAIEKRTGNKLDQARGSEDIDPERGLRAWQTVIRKMREKPSKRKEQLIADLMRRWEARTGQKFPEEGA